MTTGWLLMNACFDRNAMDLKRNRMLVVGLVGGVASGKSRIATWFAERGATILDGDKVGHEVLRSNKVKQVIHQKWGDTVFQDDGEVNRRHLAAIVFDEGQLGKSNLKFLESLVHPEIRSELLRELEHARQLNTKLVILDAPVLIKAGWSQMCDEILFVDVPRHRRLERAINRGWTESMFDQRESAQTPLSEKKERATCQIDNSGDWSQTESELLKLWNAWFNDK